MEVLFLSLVALIDISNTIRSTTTHSRILLQKSLYFKQNYIKQSWENVHPSSFLTTHQIYGCRWGGAYQVSLDEKLGTPWKHTLCCESSLLLLYH